MTRGEALSHGERVQAVRRDIVNARYALSLLPEGSSRRVKTLIFLTTALAQYHQLHGDMSSLEEARKLWRQLSTSYPHQQLAADTERSLMCETLAVSLFTCHQTTGEDSLQLEGLELRREALALSTRDPTTMSLCYFRLGTTLLKRSSRAGDQAYLIEAINCFRQSISLLPPGHSQPAHHTNVRLNLAISLSEIHKNTGTDSYLIEAIKLLRDLLALSKDEYPNRWLACRSLATALFLRYERTSDKRLLDEITRLYRESLALGLRDLPRANHGDLYLHLSISLRTQYGSTGDHNMLVEAVDYNRRALDLRSKGHPEHPIMCVNMADSLKALYDCTGDSTIFSEAIDLYRDALSTLPTEHSLHARCVAHFVSALQTRYSLFHQDAVLFEIHQVSAACLRKTFHSEAWRFLCNLAWVHLQVGRSLFNVKHAIYYLSQCLKHEVDYAVRALGSILPCLENVWSLGVDAHLYCVELFPVYQQLIKLLPLLINPVLETQDQLRLLSSCWQVGPDAFVTGVRANATLKGLESLELAKGVVWSQRLHRRDPQLEILPAPLAMELKGCLKDLNPATYIYQGDGAKMYHSSYVVTSLGQDVRHNQGAHLHAVLKTVRSLPGLENFMLGETAKNLCSVATLHHVVILVGSRDLYYALIMTLTKPVHALITLDWKDHDFPCAAATYEDARLHRGDDISDNLLSMTNRLRGMSKVNSTPLSRLMKHTWLKIVKPIINYLNIKPSFGKLRPRLHWCPSGRFNTLPLHAAGIYDGPPRSRDYCANYIVSSYTPTLTALLRVQRSTSPIPRPSISVLLAGEKQAHDPRLNIIPGVDAEMEAIAATAKSHNVQTVRRVPGPTTVRATRFAMMTANVVHLACHGVQDNQNMTQSGFCLGNGRLTISALMKLRIDKAFLAFLSACETAKGDNNQPDQAMHLAAAMLFVGFKAVIATMWAISDIDGPHVARWFYEELFAAEAIDADLVAYSLDIAIGKLRDSGVSLDRWAPFIHMGA